MKPKPLLHYGFSLIEVLVALVILSVGMLGVLTLQVKGLQFGHTAMTNTKALNAASDMADRIRANPAALDGYAVDFGGAGSQPSPACADDSMGMVAGLGCSPIALAAYDIWQWKSQMLTTGGLPQGDGKISVAPPAAGQPFTNYTIDMKWVERGEQQQYQLVLNN